MKKNIFLLPTDKPSRLGYISESKTYHLYNNDVFLDELANAINIYITSSEEIKKGDWYYTKRFGVGIAKNEGNTKIERTANSYHKIILTTDTTLIVDGVQKIDDEFLEWFIKNPSCESVEVESMINMVQFTPREFIYKIIIPQEDPFEKSKLALRAYLLANKEKVTKDLQEMREKSSVDRNETVEEAAETWVFETNGHKWSSNDNTAGDNYGSFKAGATWQAERMYSEEEVEKMVRAAYTFGEKEFKYFGAFKEWFEQFKKK
jgi:hypothetical protein